MCSAAVADLTVARLARINRVQNSVQHWVELRPKAQVDFFRKYSCLGVSDPSGQRVSVDLRISFVLTVRDIRVT